MRRAAVSFRSVLVLIALTLEAIGNDAQGTPVDVILLYEKQ
jgi:hypothetical protein